MLANAVLASLPLVAAAITFTPQDTEVVIPADSAKECRVVRFAAQELTNFLSRAFGCVVPVSHRIDPAKRSIVLGANEWSRAAGIDVTTLPVDGFVLRTRGTSLYIAGRDANVDPARREGAFARSTLFGVYEFLERFAGCRFYFPGELGEIVPRCGKVTVGEIDRVFAPAMPERRISGFENCGTWYDPAYREKRFYPIETFRLRLETHPIPCCHGLRKFKYVKRFGKTHPEYFLMKRDGTRDIMDSARPLHLNNKFCFSNPGFREEIYRDVKAYLTGQPPESRGLESWGGNCAYGTYVDIMPEDGPIHCWCPDCTAAYAKARDADDEANELMWGYTIDIAERLKREGVPGFITQMAYGSYRHVPARKIPDNVIVTVCSNGGWVRERRARLDDAEMKAWFDNVGKVKLYNNCGKHGVLGMTCADVPAPTPRAIGGYYNRMSPMARGALCSNETDRFLCSALTFYVFAKIAWNGPTDLDALLEEYYRLMFGAGAKPMQDFFEELERKWMTEVLGVSVDTELGTANLLPSEFRVWTELYSTERIRPLAALVDRAAAAVPPDSLEAKRIALMRREVLEPMQRHAAAYAEGISVEAEKARRAANPKPSLVPDFRPVTITVPAGPLKKPFEAVKHPIRTVPGRRYRVSYFVKGENVVPQGARGGAQAVAWRSEAKDRGTVIPPVGYSGTFDWIHCSGVFQAPFKPGSEYRPEVDLRLHTATGTVSFDGLVVEELD